MPVIVMQCTYGQMLISQFGSDTYQIREAASRNVYSMIEYGYSALLMSPLKRATVSCDLEIAYRAKQAYEECLPHYISAAAQAVNIPANQLPWLDTTPPGCHVPELAKTNYRWVAIREGYAWITDPEWPADRRATYHYLKAKIIKDGWTYEKIKTFLTQARAGELEYRKKRHYPPIK